MFTFLILVALVFAGCYFFLPVQTKAFVAAAKAVVLAGLDWVSSKLRS